MTKRIGVGIIGAGMAAQAIHLPTLATLPDRFRVVHIMDTDLEVATEVASRVGARASATVEALLADAAVEVVAVCSPDRFHADHVVAACWARKRAVLCEKPLATTAEDGWRIEQASVSTGVSVVVGTMHAYDPAFVAAQRAWDKLQEAPHLVRSVIYLPSVEEMVSLATEHFASTYISFVPSEGPFSQDERARLMRTTVLDLAIHNIPLIRRFLPTFDEVTFARVRAPFGYVISIASGDRHAQMLALMWGRWRPDWTFDVWGPRHTLHVEFPPSYVLAGSATARLSAAHERTVWSFPRSGYQALWDHVADVVNVGAANSARDAVEDLTYALGIADGAERLVREPS